ncbi:MAG: hypothetical protein HC842_01165 [Cytophagales bacterium]|nr:hypothetical protein [Cytophagales bacterium]
MKRSGFGLLLFLGGNAFSTLLAQPLVFRTYGIEQGLPHSIVKDIEQDERGYLWLVTGNGITQFDGHQFTKFKAAGKPSHVDGYNIHDLFVQPGPVLWLATSAGLEVLDQEQSKTHFFDFRPWSQRGAQWSYISKDGTAWCLAGGLFRYDSIETRFVQDQKFRYSHTQWQAPREDSTGRLWIWGAGLYVIEPGAKQCSLVANQGMFEQIAAFTSAGADLFWLCNNKRQIILYHAQHGVLKVYDDFSSTFSALSATVSSMAYAGGYLWISTTGEGLYRFEPSSGVLEQIRKDRDNPEGLPSDHINVVFADVFGSLWLGTLKGGLSQLDLYRKPIQTWSTAQGLADNNVQVVFPDAQGRLWLGTWDAGLHVLLAGDDKPQPVPLADARLNNIGSIAQTANGDLWLASWLGCVARLRITSQKPLKYETRVFDNYVAQSQGFKGWSFRKAYVDHRDSLWLASFDGGLLQVRNAAEEPQFISCFADSVGLWNIYSCQVGGADFLWIGTEYGGLVRYDMAKRTWKSFNRLSSQHMPGNNARGLFQDSRGQLWLSHAEGISLLTLNEEAEISASTWITEGEGLPSRVIYGFLEDSLGYVWATSEHGLVKLDSRGRVLQVLSGQDGLASDEFNIEAYAQRAGLFYLGGIGGCNVLDPLQMKPNPTPARLEMLLHLPPGWSGKLKEGHELLELNLDYHNKAVNVEFKALHLSKPGQNSVRYQIGGGPWTVLSAEQRFLQLDGLPEGVETLIRGQALSADGVPSSVIKTLKIYVNPPLWRRTWFKISLVTSLLGLLFLVYYERERRSRLQTLRLERQVQRRTHAVELAKAEIESRNEALLMLNEQLRQEKELTTKQAQQLAELDQAKSVFFRSLSNRLSVPLSILSHAFASLQAKAAARPELHDELESVGRQNARLQTMVKEMADFTRLIIGRGPARKSAWIWFGFCASC